MRRFVILLVVLGDASSALAAPVPGPGWSPAAMGQWFGGLVLVLALVFLSLWGLRRLQQWSAPAGGQIRVLGGLSLGGRERLLLVEVGEVQLVLGVSPGRVQTLHVLEGDRRIERMDRPSFSQQLQQVLERRSS